VTPPLTAAAEKICTRCGNAYPADAAFCALDGTALKGRDTGDPYIGTVIHGDIEIQALAGEGAMGRVYRGHQRGTERDVAVKILHKDLSSRQQLVQRFLREAKIASKLRHPHVVEVYFTGPLPDGALSIVMEYLDGTTLQKAIALAGGKLPPPRALAIALQICDAVGEGHTQGVVHRDLKPDNVILISRAETEDWVKVLDFGIARASTPEESIKTVAGAVFGTARYISPEGAQGMKVTPASDVYSIAVMLYEMLSGHVPFDADESVGILLKHVHEAPPTVRSWKEGMDVGEVLEKVVMDNLAKDPALRAADGRAFAGDLLRAAEVAGIHVPEGGYVRKSHVAVTNTTLPISDAPKKRPVVAPTLDDAPPVSPPPARPSRDPASVPEQAAAPPKRAFPAWIFLVLLAFVVGGGSAAGVMHYAGRERLEALNRTRAALNDGHYVQPPGENVRELVAKGLERWPGDTEFLFLRGDAEQQMLTMAMTARATGDIVGAHNLAQDAYAFEPTDNSARTLRAQTEDELAGVTSGATLATGPPRIVFESPPVAPAGQKTEMTCRILPGSAGPKARLSSVRVSLFPNGQTTNGTPVVITSTDTWNLRMSFVAPGPGSYDIAFAANVDGTVLRANRDLDVPRPGAP
jgi:serine/threonine-protein kinase